MKTALRPVLTAVLTAAFIIFSCQKLDIQKIMVIKTKSVSDITGTTANIKGEVVDLGEGMTDYGVYYSTNTNTKAGTKISIGKPAGAGSFTASLTELTPSTKYYTCVYGARNNSFVYGDEVSFTTLGAPTLTTTGATAITPTSATIGGNVTLDGGATVTDRGVYWRLSTSTDTTGTKLQIGTGVGLFTASLSSLTPNTTYTFKAYATNVVGTTLGAKFTFTTNIAIPTVSTTTISSITDSSAAGGGNVTNDGGGSITAKGVCWSVNVNPTVGLSTKTSNGAGTGTFTSSLTNLAPGTTYHVKAYATNSAGTGYGEDAIFTTSAVKPSITTTAVTSITSSSALGGGSVTSTGGSTVTARGVCWSTSANPTVDLTTKTINGSGSGSFTSNITGLTPSTSYHVRAYATNAIGTTYGDDISFLTTDGVITISTTAISSITASTATGGGSITSDGGAAITSRGVCWSVTANPTISDTKSTNGTGIGVFTSSITGLTPNVEYHVRAFATNEVGTCYGEDIPFLTTNGVITITTTAISSITSSTAAGGGNITSDGGEAVTARGVCWSTTINPTTTDSKTTDGTGTGVFSSSLTNLSPGTTYHVRAYATNAVGTIYGEDLLFTTLANLPTLTTTSITDITSTGATCGGSITSDGGGTITSRGVCWSTAANPTVDLATKTSDGTGIGAFTSSVDGLNYATTYHIRAYAINSAGTAYGADIPFTTSSISPTVTTAAITAVTSTTATSGGNVTSTGGSTIIARGVCWSTTENPTIDLTTKTTNGIGDGAFTSSITGLTPGGTYHVRAYATNSIGTSYGEDVLFSSSAVLPILTTTPITDITATAATSGGSITSDGGGAITARGVCWSTTANPTVDLTSKTTDGTGSGSFTSSITGLSVITVYHVRAYATNSAGTAYGADVTFTSAANLPTLTTTTISAIMANTATSGGNITANGGAAVTSRGVCWSTTVNPTIASNKTTDGSGSGVFTSNITNLYSSTTYYVRAYATNSAGTGYGDELSFTTGIAPTVTTTDITAITSTTSTSGGNVTASGGSPVTARGVCWSASVNPTLANSKTTDGSGTGIFTSSLTGLTPNTVYYVRAYATNTSGTGYGTEKVFTTLSLPSVTTRDITGITATTATGGGEVTFEGNTSVTERGICWSTSPNPTTSSSRISSGNGLGVYTGSISGLTPNTTYYVRAYAINILGTSYGMQKFFTSGITLPTITTSLVSNINGNSATSGGNITSDGGSTITARGVCWSTSQNPTLSDNQTFDGSGTGTFTSSLTGLSPNNTYFVRSYTTNSEGTVYGNQQTFTTTSGLPLLNTTSVSKITAITSTSGGNISSDNGFAVTARGVVWSINQNPTISDNQTYDGLGTGTFTSNLTGLSPNNTYYLRSYATNSVGTTYGNEFSFTTPSFPTIGATYAGGIVFYIDNTGEHGLVCASSDQSTGTTWSGALYICSNLIMNDFDDWFLPSIDQLNLMYDRFKVNQLGGFSSGVYWSSTDYGFLVAGLDFSGQLPGYSSYKENSLYVRAVRSF